MYVKKCRYFMEVECPPHVDARFLFFVCFFSYNTVYLSSGPFAWHAASFLKPFRDHSYQRICAAEGSSFTLVRQSALPWQASVYTLQNIFHTIKLQVNKACWEDLGYWRLMGKIILIFVLSSTFKLCTIFPNRAPVFFFSSLATSNLKNSTSLPLRPATPD